jgi:hypothetical protein
MLGSDIWPKHELLRFFAERIKSANSTVRELLVAYRMNLPVLHSLFSALLARRLLHPATEGDWFFVLGPNIKLSSSLLIEATNPYTIHHVLPN